MIELQNVSKIYNTGKIKFRALNDISLKIDQGEFVAIMGPSGSGKSTLLNILGFLDRPDTGNYEIYGKDVTELDDDELSVFRNHIAGFVFQQFHLLPKMTALENAELPLIYAGKRKMKEAAKEKIRNVGLGHRETHYPNEMSGGEQQRVAIARSMANEPLIIFADEPTGNLDTKSEEEIISILKKLNEKGKTIIMVTHENEIANNAKRIIRMRDGEIISDEAILKSRKKKNENPDHIRRINEALTKSHGSFGRAEFIDYLRQAVNCILSHKLRSFLSMFGILIGVASVISMLALGEGARASISEKLTSLGSNLISVRPGAMRHGPAMLEAGSVTRIEIQDAKAIARLNEVKYVSPGVTSRAQLVYGSNNWNSLVQGASPEYEKMRAVKPVVGKFFTEKDVQTRSRVTLIGKTVLKELFNYENPVGKEIKINRISFTVIGVLPERGSTGFRDQDDIVIIPYTTAMYRLLGKNYLDSIDVEAKDAGSIDSAINSIEKIIIKRHHLTHDQEDSFHIRDMTEIREVMTSTTKTMSMLLGSVAAISLVVGGIGVMNIMLVSVKERTKEIGLRKAIGARSIDVMVQFLIESVLMTFSGGISGILLGFGVSFLMSSMAGWAIKISIFSVILSTGFSIIVGICFGFYPAVQASRLKPIEALRYE